jgi:hypothetical protein
MPVPSASAAAFVMAGTPRAMQRSGELALATIIWPASLVLRSLMRWWGKDMRS